MSSDSSLCPSLLLQRSPPHTMLYRRRFTCARGRRVQAPSPPRQVCQCGCARRRKDARSQGLISAASAARCARAGHQVGSSATQYYHMPCIGHHWPRSMHGEPDRKALLAAAQSGPTQSAQPWPRACDCPSKQRPMRSCTLAALSGLGSARYSSWSASDLRRAARARHLRPRSGAVLRQRGAWGGANRGSRSRLQFPREIQIKS